MNRVPAVGVFSGAWLLAVVGASVLATWFVAALVNDPRPVGVCLWVDLAHPWGIRLILLAAMIITTVALAARPLRGTPQPRSTARPPLH